MKTRSILLAAIAAIPMMAAAPAAQAGGWHDHGPRWRGHHAPRYWHHPPPRHHWRPYGHYAPPPAYYPPRHHGYGYGYAPPPTLYFGFRVP